jgi:UDP-N-acetylglucosamine acyltransferase
MSTIHKTAIVSKNSKIHPTATIGPYAVVEGDVEIGARTVLGPHAIVRQFTRIGEDNIIDPNAIIGGLPQHAGYDGSETWVIVGSNNVFRESVTVNRAFHPGGATRIGSGCFLMANAHVGHDCVVEDNTTLTNGVVLGGHVEVGRNATMGGYAGAHQFVRVGGYSMVGGYIPLRKDALPFMTIGGEPIRHYRLNSIGLRRSGIRKERFRALETAFRAIRNGDKSLKEIPDTEEIIYLRDWLKSESKYGVYGFAGAT